VSSHFGLVREDQLLVEGHAFSIDQSRRIPGLVCPGFCVASNQHTTKGEEQHREYYPHARLLLFQ
jgi:hypothetical protein